MGTLENALKHNLNFKKNWSEYNSIFEYNIFNSIFLNSTASSVYVTVNVNIGRTC